MLVFACAAKKVQAGSEDRAYIAGEVIIAIESGNTGRKGSSIQKGRLAQELRQPYISQASYLTTVEQKGRSSVFKRSGSKLSSQNLSMASGGKLDFYVGKLKEGTEVETAVEELKKQDGIFWAEPNYVCHIMDEASSYPFEADELAADQWYLDNLQAKKAWSVLEGEGKTPGQGVTVAVIDTGVSLAHSDLIDNIWVNETEKRGEDGKDDDGNGYVDDIYGVNLVNVWPDMTDSHGHGTMMAGIIAMEAGNGGGAGIAYGSRIMPIKVSVDGEFGTDLAVEGIQYALDNGADVINMSFGTYEDSLLLQSVIAEASQKCLLAAAAGNEGLATEDMALEGVEAANIYPAGYDAVVGVMAYDTDENIADFSNWDVLVGAGTEYELAAPGVRISSTALNNRYQTISGTSPATALVAGAMAVCRGIFTDKDEYPTPALQKLFVEAMTHHLDWNWDNALQLSYRKADLMDVALMAQKEELLVDREPPVAVDATLSPQSGEEYTFCLNASDNFGVQKVMLYYCMKNGGVWISREMELLESGFYQLSIPCSGQYLQEISYYFDIYDGVYHTQLGNPYLPMTLTVYDAATPSGTIAPTPDASATISPRPAATPAAKLPLATAPAVQTPPAVTGDKALSHTIRKKLQKTVPKIKRKYKRGRKKAKLTFKAKGDFQIYRYYVYRAAKKKGRYRLVAKVKKPVYMVKVGGKKKYYRMAVVIRQNGHKYKSKKSEVVVCYR